MKNRILSFIILAAGMVTSCNTDAEFSEFFPTHALSTLVKSATATCGSETVVGTVDNATHEIQFVFVNNSNFSDVAVTLEYATRAIRKEGAPEEGQKLNLSVLQLDTDADYQRTKEVDPSRCFDGKHMSKKGAYGEVAYNHFGWMMANPSKTPERGNSFTFDAGEPMRLSKIVFWPYWPYENQQPAVYELYAYTLSGEPAQTGEWTNWEKILEVDDSDKWQITKNAEAGSENDLTVNGTVVEFKYGELPEARYYRFKMLKNFYAAFGTAMNQYWSGRINYFALSEVELWRYNTEE